MTEEKNESSIEIGIISVSDPQQERSASPKARQVIFNPLTIPESVSMRTETSENAGAHRGLRRFFLLSKGELGRWIESGKKAQGRGIPSE